MTHPLNKRNLHSVVEHFLEKGGDKIAIEQGDRVCTYAELDGRSTQLCAEIRELKLGRGNVVALPMPASIDYVVALLAVVKHGGIFMPVDATFPEARLRRMLAIAQPRVVIGSSGNPEIVERIAQLSGDTPATLLLSPDSPPSAERMPIVSGDDDTGYLIHTSGSTGEPKLIAGRNKGISHFVHWETSTFDIDQSVRASFFAPPTFDVSLREIFVPLLAGGTLVIPDADVRSDARRLTDWVREQRISLMHCVPSLFRLITQSLTDNPSPLPALRLVALAGEPLYGADVSAWRAVAGRKTQLVNLYGPSETTLAKAFHRIDDDPAASAIIPLGQPIANTALLILRDGRLCEIGEVGEIHISTPFASNGYYNNPELTAQAFIPNPLTPNSAERIYRTGDLARYRNDRSVEFMGRADRQVKVNGVRIELPEIEGAMRGCSDITDAVAHTFRLASGENILVGYYTSADALDPLTVRASLQTILPDNMLPGYLLQLEEFPRNLNGKIDRRALPRPESLLELDHAYTAPQNELEAEIAKLWAETLGLDRVGVTSPYLRLGGNSLRAIGLIGRIGQRFGVDIGIRDFFESGTVRALAARIASRQTSAKQPLPLAPAQDHYPLTDAQAGLWILDKIDRTKALYNNVEWLELHGPLDANALQHAFQMLIERHESLRTAYLEVDGEPRQRILETGSFIWKTEHSDDAETRVKEILSEERKHHFDLTSGELLRARLLRQNDDLHHLIVNMHHIACDGWSMSLLVRDLCANYDQRNASTPASNIESAQPHRMRDVACWLANNSNSETTMQRAEEWRARLADADNRATIPMDQPSDLGIESSITGQVQLEIPVEQAAILRQHLSSQGATPFMAIAAVLSILLYRHGGSETVIIGTPLAGRSRSELTDVVGFIVNTLPLVLRLSPDLTFSALLDKTKQAVQNLSESEFDTPAKLINHHHAAAAPSRNPFFDVVLAMEPAPGVMKLDGLQVIEREIPDAPARYDLSLRLQDNGEALRLILEYRKALYQDATMTAMLAQLTRLLTAGAAEPMLPLRRLPMLSAEECEAIKSLAQGPIQPLPQTTIHQAFSQQAERTPSHTALIAFESDSSYRWLDQRANRIAAALREEMKVQPGEVVAILLDREPEWPAAILGILKAGAVYLPLDPWHPAARHRELMQDAGARVLISREAMNSKNSIAEKNNAINCVVLDLDTLDGVINAVPAVSIQPDDPAYLIYTSGSTGTPKGVLISHRAFLNMITDHVQALGMSGDDTVLQFVSPAFDVSLFEIFLALLSGARLALVDRQLCNTANGFADSVARLKITVAAMTPGFLNSLGDLSLPGLRIIITGGEAPIAAEVQCRLQQGIRYINAYGPTEAAVCAAFYEVDGALPVSHPIPIGRATANLALHVVAPDLTPLPLGAIGELAIAGPGLALEYYRRPSATELAFVTNTLATGTERLYRTGDRARRLQDGTLLFIGRNDEQVKIRGHRIEVGEVEAVLRKQSGIRDARVLPRSIGQDLELIAYWVGEEKDDIDLREALAQHLPEYMVPRLFMQLDALPLNANGKLDRGRLPEPTQSLSASHQTPLDANETHLAGILRDLLGHEHVGRHDNFFELGGSSLMANRLALRASRALGVQVEIADIYSAPTVAGLASLLRDRVSLSHDKLPDLPLDQPAPLSPMQRRLWVIDQLGESGPAYHICGLTRLSGTLNVAALWAAFNDVAARHAVLRTRFVSIDGEPKQVTDPVGPLSWISLPAGLNEDTLQTQLEEIGNRPFDLAHEWPIRIALAEEPCRNENQDQTQHQLLVVLHHIAADGWSMPLLEAELTQAYIARLQDAAPEWTPLPAQYRDIAAWLEQRLHDDAFANDRDYWLQKLQGSLPLLDLPSDRPRPAVRRFQGTTLHHVLREETVNAARTCADTYGVSLFTVLLAGLQMLFYRLSGQDDLIIGAPVAGRQHPASENLIGFFVNTLALRERIDGKQGFATHLASAAQTMRQAISHQSYPFDRLVGDLNIPRDTSRSALFDVMIGLDEASTAPNLPDVTAESLPLQRSGSRCDMSWMFDFGAAIPSVRIEYDTDLFEKTRIDDWAQRFEHLLRAAIQKPQAALNELDLLLEGERVCLLNAAIAPASPLPNATVIELFEEQAAIDDAKLALITDTEKWTYGTLNRAANRLARTLRRARSDGMPDSPIALLATRGPLMAVAQLAIQKCGAAYLPIEPDAPAERIALLLSDSRAEILLCQPGLEPAGTPATLTILPLIIPDEGQEDNANLPLSITPDDPIYVMYTSGSTGRPKGVIALHRGVARVTKQPDYFTPQSGDRILQLSNYAFDGATFDFYAALTNGLTLCLPDQDTVLDPQALAGFVQRHGVNVSFITTALFNRLVDETPELLSNFRRLYFGGQEASLPHVRRALTRMTADALVHVYGPTECTTFATWHTVHAEDINDHAVRLPIGRPIAHTSSYVLDARQMLLPPGVPGELYIGGLGLARGYLGQEEMTAACFVDSPFAKGERLYRTGDLCMQNADGIITFLGRLDGQVKVRGFRIEIGEIEHHLLTHTAVEKVHVMPRRNETGNTELVAYVTARDANNPPNLPGLIAHLEHTLPRYMLPAHFVLLDAMPVNRNGKVDRNALPLPEANNSGFAPLATLSPQAGEGAGVRALNGDSVNTLTPNPSPACGRGENEMMAVREKALLDAWRTTLKRDAIGMRDNYFAIGGDSIQAIQIVSRLRKQGFTLKVTDLLRYPTIEQLAPLLSLGELQRKHSVKTNGDIPLTPIQQWLVEKQPAALDHFNQSILLRLPAGSDPKRISRALAALELHHEVLRLRFGIDANGKPWQRLAPLSDTPTLAVHRLMGNNAAQAMLDEINRVQRSLSPENGPIWRAAFFHLAAPEEKADGDRLFITIHHWAVDGVSWRVLLDDLASAYEQAANPETAITLPAPSQSFAEWACALRDAAASQHFISQLDYWRQQMTTETGSLPRLENEQPAPLSERLAIGFSLSVEQTTALFGPCHDAYRTRSDELLIAAWVYALTTVQGHQTCRLVLESHGRDTLPESMDTSRTVGWFTAVYPRTFKLDSDRWNNKIRQVKENLRAVPDRGVGYGLLRYLRREPELMGNPGEIVFNYLGHFDHENQPLPIAAESTGDELAPTIRLAQSLDVSAEVRDGQLHVRLVGDCARHPASCFHALNAGFELALQEVIEHCLSSDAGGLSPSDVDLQDIDIGDLDGILDSLENA